MWKEMKQLITKLFEREHEHRVNLTDTAMLTQT